MKKRCCRFLAIIFGNILYALTVKLFLMPSGLITGGSTGIALFLSRSCGLSPSVFLLVFNTSMLLLGLAVLGRGFAMTTLLSTFLYPAALAALDALIGDLVMTEDLLLCTVFSGLGIGVSLGMVIRAGASTGGMDIPPLVMNRLWKTSVSGAMYGFDFAILLLQAAAASTDKVLYGILLIITYTLVLDRALLIGTSRTEVRIISRVSGRISEVILHQMDRGVTLLDGEGGFLHERGQIVLTVISNRELARLERLVHDTDPDCFMIINRVTEVRGRGFSSEKVYAPEKEDRPAS